MVQKKNIRVGVVFGTADPTTWVYNHLCALVDLGVTPMGISLKAPSDGHLVLPGMRPPIQMFSVPQRVRAMDVLKNRAALFLEYGFQARQKMARAVAEKSEALLRAAREADVALLHAHGGHRGVCATQAAEALNLPLVVSFHGSDLTKKGHRAGWSLYRRLLGHAIAATSNAYMADLIRRHLGLSAHRIRHAVDLQRFPKKETRSQWQRPTRLLIVAQLRYRKGIQVALEGLAHLHSGGHGQFTLDVIGGGTFEAFLKARAKDLGLCQAVRFLGRQPHDAIPEAMAQADLLLAPSVFDHNGFNRETFCISALEASAMGLPVIGSSIAGLAETLSEVGVAVPPFRHRELAAAIRKVTEETSPAQWVQRADAIRRKYALEGMTEDCAALMKELSIL
jgi:glycosyltransferase involved in cell wall biosynthesis